MDGETNGSQEATQGAKDQAQQQGQEQQETQQGQSQVETPDHEKQIAERVSSNHFWYQQSAVLVPEVRRKWYRR